MIQEKSYRKVTFIREFFILHLTSYKLQGTSPIYTTKKAS